MKKSNIEGGEELEMTEIHREAPAGDPPMGGSAEIDGTEVVAVAKRRKLTDAFKLKILEELDRAAPGETGLILRRDGLYSSQITKWRKRRREMSGKKQKKTTPNRVETENKRLEKENAKLKLKLRKAEAMLDLQKKAASIISLMTDKPEYGSSESL